MFEIFFLIYLGYRNSIRAKTKGLNGLVWAVYTGLSYMTAYVIGMTFVYMVALRSKIVIPADPTKAQYQDVAHQLTQEFVANPLLLFTVYFFGIGGFLLIRFVIDQKPGKPDGPIHWMDKLNNESQQNEIK